MQILSTQKLPTPLYFFVAPENYTPPSSSTTLFLCTDESLKYTSFLPILDLWILDLRIHSVSLWRISWPRRKRQTKAWYTIARMTKRGIIAQIRQFCCAPISFLCVTFPLRSPMNLFWYIATFHSLSRRSFRHEFLAPVRHGLLHGLCARSAAGTL